MRFKSHRPNWPADFLAGGIVLLLITFFSFSDAGTWSVSGGLQYLQGKYIYTTSTSTWYLYGGLQYRTKRWNVGASLPLISQNSDLVSSSAGVFVPSGHTHRPGGGDPPGGGHPGGGMMGGGGTTIETSNVDTRHEIGLGDTYVSGQYSLLSEQHSLPAVALSAQVKIPTGNTTENFSTGKFDYSLGVNLSRRWGRTAGFLNAAYWRLGNPAGVTYQNPFTYGIGVGHFFSGGRLSALLYYQGYTTILEGYDPPRQINLGLYYRSGSKTLLSGTLSAGLSDTSPAVGIYLGFTQTL
ncbi:MAG: transporter [Calditrichia bacterium]